jgi:hypothetical protein
MTILRKSALEVIIFYSYCSKKFEHFHIHLKSSCTGFDIVVFPQFKVTRVCGLKQKYNKISCD